MADLVEALSTADAVEARLVAAALEGEGLHPTVLGEGMSEMLFAGKHAVPCRVMVPADERDAAREAIAAIRASVGSIDEDAPQACPDCGAPWEPGFAECWRCHGEPDVDDERDEAWGDDPATRVDEQLDVVTVVARRPPVSMKAIRLVVVPGIALYLLLGGFGLLITFVAGVVVLAVGSFRTVTIKVDLHGIDVDGERMLWEDLRDVSAGRYLFTWEQLDGTEGSLRLLATEEQLDVLQRAIAVHRRQDRAPRDEASEQAVQQLLDRP